MIAVAGALAAALAVALVGWAHRPHPDRLRAAAPTTGGRGRRGPDPAGAVGSFLLRGRSGDAAAARRLGRAVLAGLAVAPLLPPAAPAVGMVVWVAPAFSARRRARRELEEVVQELPEVVDLLVLAVGGGHTVGLALAAVAPRCPGRVGTELGRVVREVGLGRRLADALDELPARLGEPVRPLAAALAASERYGAPLLDGLVRLSDEVRHDRRRRAEAAARRIPVKLLFPLVCCTLPAFGLLTVAPLLAGGLRSLRL